jgi:CheY-like chemotaxis protein
VRSDQNPSLNAPTVLVLDDEPLVREMARRFLTRSGYRCIEAGTVDAAIELMRTTEIVAAMFDMRLPNGQTGLDALRNLRQYPALREIPVLIVTGSILTDAERTAITKQRGFVFQKPEGFSTIVNFLDQLTGRDTSG